MVAIGNYWVGLGSLLIFFLIYRRFLKRMSVPVTPPPKAFCAACGTPHAGGAFCAHCGAAAKAPAPAVVVAPAGGGEQ